MKIVSNTSPIIFLAKIDRLDLLKHLFKQPVLVPQSVVEELGVGKRPETGSIDKYSQAFKFVFVTGKLPGADFLGKGEQQAILLAKKQKADLLLIDDKQARIIAEALGINVRGTAGILFESLKKGLLDYDEWAAAIMNLVANHNFRISIELYNRMLQEAQKYKLDQEKISGR